MREDAGNSDAVLRSQLGAQEPEPVTSVHAKAFTEQEQKIAKTLKMEQASITVSRLVHDEIEQAQALVKHMDLPPVSLKEKPTLPRATSYGPVFGSAGHYVLGHASWIDDIVKVSAKAVSIFALDPGQEPEVCAVAQLLYKSQPARNARGTEHHRELPVLG